MPLRNLSILRLLTALPCLALGLGGMPAPGHAQTWDGGGNNNNWTTDNNWNPNSTPVNDGTANIIFAGNVRLSVNVNSARNVNSITFNNTAGAFTLSNNSITIQGGGITNNDTDLQTINSGLTLGASQTWNANSGNLALGGTVTLGAFELTLTGANATTLSGSIQGTGSVVKGGSGTVTYSGGTGNTYSGTTTVNAGTLVLAKTSGDASQGSWIVGDGTGTDTLRLGASQQIQDSSSVNVTVNSSGVFDLNGFNETLSQITLAGGAVTTGSGTLTIGNLGGAGITSNASATGASISGNLALAPFSTTITVADGAAASDLTISAAISGNRIIKEGAGVLVLSGANTFTDGGVTGFNPALTINAGTVSISAANNLGNAANDVWLNGGTLRVTGNINSASTQLYYVNSGGGTFEVTPGNTLTWDDADQLRSSGSSGTLTKTGGGTLLITQDNDTNAADTFSGPVVVSAGILRLETSNNSMLLGSAGNTTGESSFVKNLGDATSFTVNNGGTWAIAITSTTAFDRRIILQDNATLAVNNGGILDWSTARTDIEFYGTVTMDGPSASATLAPEDDIKYNGSFTMTNGAQMTGDTPDGVLVGNDGSGLLSIQSGSDATFILGGPGKLEQRFTIFNGGTTEVTGSGSTLNLERDPTTNISAPNIPSIDINSGGTLRLADGGTAHINDAMNARMFNGSIFDGGTASGKGTLVLDGGNLQARSPTVTNTPNVTMATSTTSSIEATPSGSGTGGITGLGTFTKTGTGTTTITSSVGTNNFGAQTIDVQQGTLLFGASNRVADSSQFRMAGGTLATGGFSDTVGTLTLTANSTIDLGSGASILNFANSAATSWTGGASLSITNWSGIPVTGGGTDQVFFGSSAAGLTSSQLSQIFFINPAGLNPGTYAATILQSGEIVPVPEPGVWAVMALLGGWLLWREHRRRARV